MKITKEKQNMFEHRAKSRLNDAKKKRRIEEQQFKKIEEYLEYLICPKCGAELDVFLFGTIYKCTHCSFGYDFANSKFFDRIERDKRNKEQTLKYIEKLKEKKKWSQRILERFRK